MAAATTTIGSFGTDRVWGTSGNWSSSAPATNSTSLLAGSLANQGIDGGDTTKIGASALLNLRIAESWLGDLGSSGSFLQFDCTGELRFSSGALDGNESHLIGDFGDVYVDHQGMHTDALVLDNRSVATGDIWHSRGNLKVIGSFTNLRSHPTRGNTGGAFLTIDAAAAVTLLQCQHSRVKCSKGIATVDCFGATVFQHLAGTITTLNVNDESKFSMEGGLITAAWVRGGKLDMSQSYTDKTITDLYVWGDAVLDLRNYAGTNSVTNLHIVQGSPRILTNTGSNVTI